MAARWLLLAALAAAMCAAAAGDDDGAVPVPGSRAHLSELHVDESLLGRGIGAGLVRPVSQQRRMLRDAAMAAAKAITVESSPEAAVEKPAEAAEDTAAPAEAAPETTPSSAEPAATTPGDGAAATNGGEDEVSPFSGRPGSRAHLSELQQKPVEAAPEPQDGGSEAAAEPEPQAAAATPVKVVEEGGSETVAEPEPQAAVETPATVAEDAAVDGEKASGVEPAATERVERVLEEAAAKDGSNEEVSPYSGRPGSVAHLSVLLPP